jgi:TolB protein
MSHIPESAMDKLVVVKTTQLTDGSAVDLRPNWNVDGTSIVFERKTALGSHLWMLRLHEHGASTCESIDLCNAGGTKVQGRAAFFAQDDFAFVSDRSGASSIWRANLAQKTCVPLTQPVADEADYGPTTSPDAAGRFLFFRIIGERSPHLFEGAIGGGIQPLTVGADQADQAWFLPGAREIVFHSKRDAVSAAYRQLAERGAPATRLGDIDEATNFVTPYPSPDGRWVAFASACDGSSQIWVARSDGSQRQRLTEGPTPACFPAWSPSGDRIVFVRGDPNVKSPTGSLHMLTLRLPAG